MKKSKVRKTEVVPPSRPFAVITGASSGIGEAYAQKLASEGYDLLLVARRKDRLAALSKDLTAQHAVTVEFDTLDLSRAADVSTLSNKLLHLDRPIDLLVNNAGYGTHGAYVELDLARELNMIDLNIKAVVALAHAAAQRMVVQKSGTIVNVASVGGLVPTPYFAVYGATKSFVVSFSESLGAELRSHGVKVQALCPGPTTTEFGDVANYQGRPLPSFATETAEGVVNESYGAIKKAACGSAVVISSPLYRASAMLTKFMPRAMQVAMSTRAGAPVH